ncbi:MAG: 50S ribosomal protein L21 [Candidatus Omnitrophica bacterium]|nr:50S ribosomal protein L21 [Candidatus Omnitrophota bacterium]
MSKYAIVETGSKQYWVEPEAVLEVEKLEFDENQKEIDLTQVLFAKDGTDFKIGEPVISGAKVVCEILGNMKGKKVITYKFRRRKASRNMKGHRQTYTRLRVKEIKF